MLTSLAKAMVTPTPLPARAPIHVRTPIPVVEEPEPSPETSNTRIGKNWTASEDQEMLAQVRQGSSLDDIARQHNRTPGGVKNRLLKLVHQMSMDGKASLEEVCSVYHVTTKDVDAFLEVNRERAAAKKAAQQQQVPLGSSGKRAAPAGNAVSSASNRKAPGSAADGQQQVAQQSSAGNHNAALRSVLLELSDYLKLMANRMAH